MFTFENLKNDLDQLYSYVDLTNKEIDLRKYPDVENETCGGEIHLIEIFDRSNLSDIYINFKPLLDNPDISCESQIIPVIESFGNVYICLGFGVENKGFVYYFDFDFGCFLLDESLDSFLSKLVDSE